jgi:glycosyltransferase involved in cell wall biosynthesis
LKIVDVTSTFSRTCGGIKRYYREKARALPNLGIECHFVVPGPERRTTAFGGGTMHELPGPPTPGNSAYHLFGRRSGLGRLIEELDPDVIELGSHYLLPLMLRPALRRLRERGRRPHLVGFFHSHPRQVVENLARFVPVPGVGDALGALMWRFLCGRHRGYQATLVASRAMEDELVARGVPGVHRVGLGVDDQVFVPVRRHHGDPFVLTYCGRFTADKELHLLLRAFPAIHARTQARLRFVGSGPLEARLRAFAAHNPGVEVGGYVDDERTVARTLAQSDAVVVPSQTETFSLTTAEALSCGTPVVGPDRGAVRELVEDSRCGRVFRAGDATSLAEAVIDLAHRSPEERAGMGSTGRAHVLANLTWAAVAARLLAAYGALGSGDEAEPDRARTPDAA